MDLEEAIKTALEYEAEVYKTYRDAMEEATDEAGRKVFETLANEEKYHLRYLGDRLNEWRQNGSITLEQLRTAVPDEVTLYDAVEKIQEKAAGEPTKAYAKEIELLRNALKVEIETSNFYKKMVEELDADGQEMFRRFVEIEEGHQKIVQAEIDCVSGAGFWFDSMEFKLEGA